MEESSPKKRLVEFVKSTGLGQTAFEDKVGLSRGAISKMKDTSGITSKLIRKITSYYTQLNPSWLLTGEGPMMKSPFAIASTGMTFGEALRKIRQWENMSVESLAVKIGVDEQKIRDWENNAGKPNDEDTELLHKFLETESLTSFSDEDINKVLRRIGDEKKEEFRRLSGNLIRNQTGGNADKILTAQAGKTTDYSDTQPTSLPREHQQTGTTESYREKYYNLLEKNNTKIQELIEKVVRTLDNINDMSSTIKSQQETIHNLITNKGNVNGRTAN